MIISIVSYTNVDHKENKDIGFCYFEIKCQNLKKKLGNIKYFKNKAEVFQLVSCF